MTTLVLGALAIAGSAAVATGPAHRPVAAAEAAPSTPAGEGEASAEDLYARAKQAYQEGHRTQALTDALAAHKKDPKDVRVKYLIYLLRRKPGDDDGNGGIKPAGAGGPKAVTITEEQVQALIEKEGAKAIEEFRDIQRILRRRCASNECHGATGTGAKWVLALKGPPNRHMLAENFRTVNRYFNREEPAQSPFLLKPLGGEKAGHPEKVFPKKTNLNYRKILNYIGTLKTTMETLWEKGK